MFSATDHAFMARALALTAMGRDTATPNPAVACVIAKGGRVIGEGWHARAGEAHAEVAALLAGAALALAWGLWDDRFGMGVRLKLLGQVAAAIRELRPPEPYKAKGVKYAEERIRRKAGKAAAATAR